MAHANAQQVTLYTLQASGLEGTDASDASFGPEDRLFQFASIGTAERAGRQESLRALAEGTGGKAILNANDLRRDLVSLREDYSTFYSLGYTPAHTRRQGAQDRGAGEAPRHPPALPRELPRQTRAGEDGRPHPGRPLLRARRQPAGDRDRNRRADAGAVRDLLPCPCALRIALYKLAILNRDETYQGACGDGGDARRRRPDGGRAAGGRPLQIPRKEVLNAMGQTYLYTLTLQLPPGGQRIAVGVRDDLAATTSYLSRAVTVGSVPVASHP